MPTPDQSAGSGGNESGFSTVVTTTETAADNSNNASALGNAAQGQALSASDGGTLNFTGSDFGAEAAASAAFQNAEGIAEQAVFEEASTAQGAIGSNANLTKTLAQEAEDTVQQQGSGALKLITKPFIWAAGLAVAGLVLVVFLWKRVA